MLGPSRSENMSNIQLVVQPEQPALLPSAFRNAPAFSIALDGYVRGKPWVDTKSPRANFNHHEGVDRLSTRSTCGQVLMAIRMGLFGRFRDQDGPRASVYVNDCDEDVCTSWALLSRPDLCQHTTNPLLNRLVGIEDLLDTTSGMYPIHKDAPILREAAWVFEPYRQFRLGGGLNKRDARAFRSTITDVTDRIHRYLTGRGESVPVDTRYERIGGGTGWTAVRELGAQARIGMLSDGIRVFVSVRERGNGRYDYVIGRASPFDPLDLNFLCAELEAEERLTLETNENTGDSWGGGDSTKGSPRVLGSVLVPEVVFRIVERRFKAEQG